MKRISDWETFIKQSPPVAKRLSEEEKMAIMAFFNKQEPEAAAASYTVDEISGKNTDIPLCSYEYNGFYWDSRDILYFDKYDMPLMSDFLDMVTKA